MEERSWLTLKSMEGEEAVIFYYREKLTILDEPIVTRKANPAEVMKYRAHKSSQLARK
jgi:hypothetical protein